MTRARRELVSLEATPYYHVFSRCVRRAFLYGEDSLTGRNYEHRKAWVVERLAELAGAFAIDLCAYAVMSNHYHLVLRVDSRRAASWSLDEIIERWASLYQLPLIVSRYRRGESQSQAERKAVKTLAEQWRQRLTDISWFMRGLNEHLARRANEEDRCTGRFWEGRFKSQALLDEAAVLACMSYVDLNPIRAGMAKTPESSDHTSIAQRIEEKTQTTDTETRRPLLLPLKRRGNTHPNTIAFSLQDYLELVDWAGRAIREDKRGAIPEHAPPILERVGLAPTGYLRHIKAHKHQQHAVVLGSLNKVRATAEKLGRKFLKGLGESRRLS